MFDYCVKSLNISPSESWHLDMMEITRLADHKQPDIDLSQMLNFERIKNGASKEWLQRGDLSLQNN